MSRVQEKRVARKSLVQRGPQSILGDKDPNYVYRFVNDTGSRVANFQAAGYEFVEDSSLVVGDSRVFDPSDIGSAKRVTSNDGTVSYLMRTKKEYYEEDQAAKAALINETEQAMKRDASQGMYGSIKVT
jgi:hypothetical protein